MRLFWRHGFEGVSIADLTGAIGIAPPSLYAAFGSKAGLYREALDRYTALPGALAGMAGAKSLEQAVAGLLEAAIKAISTEERGCMISTGLLERAEQHDALARELSDRRRHIRSTIAEALSRWLEPADAERLARYLVVVQQGLSVQARDGATPEEMRQVAGEVVASLHARNIGSTQQDDENTDGGEKSTEAANRSDSSII